MPTIIFKPGYERVDAEPDSKILAVAIRNKINIRFGCGALRCGTCGVKVKCTNGKVSPPREDEVRMLERLGLSEKPEFRMACRTRIEAGEIEVDLDSQTEYDPGE